MQLMVTAAAWTAALRLRRGSARFTRNMEVEAAANDSPHRLARLGIRAQWFVFYALFHLKTPERFCGVNGFINVGWHSQK